MLRQMPVPEELLDKLMEGDSRCKYPLQTKVRKVNSDKTDHHPNGTKGVVIGSVQLTPDKGTPVDSYIVQFDGDAHPSFTIDEKLLSEDEFQKIS